MGKKVVVITGASGGIGAALAQRLAGEGHDLVLAARREPELRRVADRAAAAGVRAVPVTADVTRRADVERLRDAALAAFGRVDVWVNNAGRGIARRVLELSDADVDEMIAANVKSALYGAQAIVPHFQRRGEGHLVNVSSFLGRVPLVAVRSAYSAAKAALNSITASLRAELRATHPGVQVSLVMPGMVATDFARNALGAQPGAAPWAGPGAGPPGPAAGAAAVQSAEDVAAAIAGLIERPVAELYTNPESPALAQEYYRDVAAFEERAASRPQRQ